MDIATNKTRRILIGCLKPTRKKKIIYAQWYGPSQIRHDVSTDIERAKAQADYRHPIYNKTTIKFRLKSRKSCLTTSRVIER